MQLIKEQLDEFKRIYKEECGVDLNDNEALEKATSLARLVEIVYKPRTKQELGKAQKRRA